MDYNNNILQAIETIISQKLHEVSFDNTIVCEIVKIKDENNGEYIVSTGTSSFTAYSSGKKYGVNQSVYVTIHQIIIL